VTLIFFVSKIISDRRFYDSQKHLIIRCQHFSQQKCYGNWCFNFNAKRIKPVCGFIFLILRSSATWWIKREKREKREVIIEERRILQGEAGACRKRSERLLDYKRGTLPTIGLALPRVMRHIVMRYESPKSSSHNECTFFALRVYSYVNLETRWERDKLIWLPIMYVCTYVYTYYYMSLCSVSSAR